MSKEPKGIASILYVDGTLRPVEIDKAIAAHNALTGLVEPTEAQADWLCTIKRIFIPPSHRPANYDAVSGSIPEYRKLTNNGVLQGMNEALPRGDR